MDMNGLGLLLQVDADVAATTLLDMLRKGGLRRDEIVDLCVATLTNAGVVVFFTDDLAERRTYPGLKPDTPTPG
jgi:hypothetical protein